MQGIWEHIQCAVSAYHMWRCGRILKKHPTHFTDREAKKAFYYHSHKSRCWSPPGCPVWVNGQAKYCVEAVGKFVNP